jgi:hypothetical protein
MAWEGPITLEAGDAMWIGAGWWHCVSAEPRAVAVPVKIIHGSVRGEAPRVFGHVAPRKRMGRSARLVSRRANYGGPCRFRTFAPIDLGSSRGHIPTVGQ